MISAHRNDSELHLAITLPGFEKLKNSDQKEAKKTNNTYEMAPLSRHVQFSAFLT